MSVVRASMATLITRVRKLVRDTDPNTPFFTDEDVQNELDMNQQVARYAMLAPEPVVLNNSVTYLDYYSSDGNWEDDVAFVNAAYQSVNPTILTDNIVGHWTFDMPGVPPPVRITGKVYDLYGAAAALADQRAADPAIGVDITTEGRAKLSLNQIRVMWMNLAKQYRMKAKPARGPLYDSDDLPEDLAWPSGISGLPGNYYD